MGSVANERESSQPHAVCIPYPAQGHITPMIHLAKLLHRHAGFYITFVNTYYNHRRLLASRGAAALAGFPGFRFEFIPDGLEQDGEESAVGESTQDTPSLCLSTLLNSLEPFRQLLRRLNEEAAAAPGSGVPPVSCIVSDVGMFFTLDAAEELSVPEVLLWTPSACSVMAYLHFKHLIQRGLIPLKDGRDLMNCDFMEKPVDWIPGLKHTRYRDLPTFVRTTDPNDLMVDYVLQLCQSVTRASAVVMNTFDALEGTVLNAMAETTAEDLLMESQKPLPPILTVGPLALLSSMLLSGKTVDPQLAEIESNLWKYDSRCLPWLDARLAASGKRSVVYVNFGSITGMTSQELVRFAWGLARSGHDFLWVIRPDLVVGEVADLPKEFVEETQGKSLLVSWCPQDKVLQHPAVGCFLTHSGWNSTLESIACGVPMLCWPFFADQQINCRYVSVEWGVAAEINGDVISEQVARLIVELMAGEEGAEIRRNAQEWKTKALDATGKGGSSFVNLEKLVQVLQRKKETV